jgi:hypothetical protein
MEKFKSLLTWQAILAIALVSIASVYVWNRYISPKLSPAGATVA